MGAITGRQGKMAFDVKAAAGFGTATACTKAIGMEPGSFSQSLNPTELSSSPVGRGESMLADKIRGRVDPTLSFRSKIGLNNGIPELMAVFFGAAPAPTEQTVSEGDYLHRISFNTTRNAYYLTMAQQWTDSKLAEWPDVWINELGISWSEFPGYVIADFNCGASNRITTAADQINTYAGLTALSAPARDEIIARQTHRFRINADSGGALADGDTVAITNAELRLSDPQETISEAKGSDGVVNRTTDLFAGTLAITLKELADFTYFDAAEAGTTYKADFVVTGDQIGAGVNEKFGAYLPLLKVVKDPDYQQGNVGINPLTVTFDIFVRSANPTGMESTYPYLEIVNELATSLLA